MSLTAPRRPGIWSGCAAAPAAGTEWRSTGPFHLYRPTSRAGSVWCWTLINGDTQLFQHAVPMRMTAQAADQGGAVTRGGVTLSASLARSRR
jgi:hypothetical protein